MAYVPDAATDDVSTSAAPPAANATSDTAPPAPPAIPATTGTPAAGSSPAPVPPMPIPPAQTGPPVPSKQTFGQGFQQGINGPQFTTDAQGNVINSASATMGSRGGLLGKIMGGMLEGAVRGIAAPTPEGARGRGSAVASGARASMEGRKAEEDRQRAIAQRTFENNQLAVRNKVEVQRQLAETANISQNMKFEAEDHPGIQKSRELQNEGLEIAHRGAMEKLNEDAYNFGEEMAKNGAPPTLFTSHGPELNAQIPGAVAGDTVAATNGIQGKGAGINTWHAADLTVPFTGQPVTINKYDKGVDKDGVPIPNPTVFTPDGKTTLTDLKNAYFQGRGQLYQMLQSHATQMTNQDQQAKLKESQEKVRLDKSEESKNYAEAAEHQANAAAVGGDVMKTTARQLVEGNEDPSQLSKRSKSYDATLKAANDYSIATYGKPFDMAQAQNDFKFAQDKGTQNTIKYAQALTAPNGNLDKLIQLSSQVGRTQFPLINDAAAWARLMTGNEAIADMHAQLVAVQDEYAKILSGASGGSVTSDQARQQAQGVINQGLSHGQLKGVTGIMRQAVDTRMREFVGNNRYLDKQYPEFTKAPPTNTPTQLPPVPTGAVRYNDANGNPIGYQTPEQKAKNTYTPYPKQ